MLSVVTIVARVLVAPFYKENTGFFLFLFFMLFGLMGSREVVLYHSSLMQTIVSTNIGLAVAMGLCLLYNYKCAAFVLNSLSKPENSFLIQLQALPAHKQFLAFLFGQFMLSLPVLLYFGITVTIGFQHGFIVGAIALSFYLLLLCMASAWLYFKRVNSFHKAPFTLPFPLAVNYTKPSILFPLYHLLQERKLALLAVKLFSGFIFYLVFIVNQGNFSLNYFRLLFLLCAAAHSMLVYYSFDFTERQLAFFRNLPIGRSTRLLVYLLTYLVLLLPEHCWLVVYSSNLMSWPELLLTFGIGLGQLLLLTSILYLPNMHLQRFGLIVCLIYMGLAMLLPSGVTIVLAAELTLALLIFYIRYYKFELMINES